MLMPMGHIQTKHKPLRRTKLSDGIATESRVQYSGQYVCVKIWPIEQISIDLESSCRDDNDDIVNQVKRVTRDQVNLSVPQDYSMPNITLNRNVLT